MSLRHLDDSGLSVGGNRISHGGDEARGSTPCLGNAIVKHCEDNDHKEGDLLMLEHNDFNT